MVDYYTGIVSDKDLACGFDQPKSRPFIGVIGKNI